MHPVKWSDNLHVSPAAIHHTSWRSTDENMDDLDVNMAMWSIVLNATLRASVHLGQDCEANLWYVKNHLWNSVG